MGGFEDPRLRRSLAAVLATASIMSAGDALAQDIAKAPDPAASSSEEIAKKLERMELRIRSLEAELKKKNDVAAASASPGNPATPASAANPPGAKPVRAAAGGAPDWVTSSQPATANAPAANPPGGKPARPV